MAIRHVITDGFGFAGGTQFIPTMGLGGGGMVEGPYYVAATDIFVAGAVETDIFVPGAAEQDVQE